MLRRATMMAVLGASTLALTAGADRAEPPNEWLLRASSVEVVEAEPPLPPPDLFPIQLVLDDDGHESTVGLGVSTASQFLWFNRFSPIQRPLTLDEVWVLFPADPQIAVGDPIEIVAYVDADGDPTNGATLLGSWDETVQFQDGTTFSIYPLPGGLTITDQGDVLIGVVPRFIVSGVDPPTAPAALDTTASQGRSWLAVWTSDPPSPPHLPPDGSILLVDDLSPGNWMIRAFGGAPNPLEIPTVHPLGAALLVLLLAVAGWFTVRERRSTGERRG